MPAVQFLHLSDNQLSGELPASWGHQGVWPQLSAMHLQTNRLEGSLPPQWATGGAFPTLQVGLICLYSTRGQREGAVGEGQKESVQKREKTETGRWGREGSREHLGATGG